MTFKSLWPPFAWALLILVLCGIPGKKIPELTFLQWLKPDKITHLAMFGLQAWLLIRAFRSPGMPVSIQLYSVAWAVSLSIVFGIVTELLQVWVSIDRQGDDRDAAAVAVGALLGAFVFN